MNKNRLIHKNNLITIVTKLVVIFLLILNFQPGAIPNVHSQTVNGIGKYGAPFLQISSSARQVAMGEAFTGLADDINLLRYNIGGLGYMNKTTIGINYHNWIEDTYQGGFSFVLPRSFAVIGFNLSYFNEGEITELDEEFTPTGSILGSNDIALTIGAGTKHSFFGLDISFGGAAKVIRQNLANESATALGMDLGIFIKKGRLSYGATLQNFSITKLKFIDREDPLPETYRAGIAYNTKIGDNFKLNTGADIAWLMNQKLRYYYGAEVIIGNVVAMRGGYKFHDFEANRWGAGLGLIFPARWLKDSQARLDYAFSPMNSFEGNTHRFSFVFTFETLDEVRATDISAEKKKISDLTDQLRLELEAAEKARKSAEEAEQRTLELEKEMAARLNRVHEIAKESRGQIEVKTEDPKSDSIWITMRINFDFDRANIRTDAFETMSRIGEILNTYPGTNVHISGHTDFIGTEEYNIRLSHRRIDSVMTYLTTKENVDLERFFMPVGYGKQQPIASNATPEGRFKNRRVDFIIYTTENKPPVPAGSAITKIELLDEKTLKITCNGRCDFNDSFIANPDRIVLDFPGIFLLMTETTIKFTNNVIIRARVGYHPDDKFSRIVLDLRSPAKYQTLIKDNLIYVRIN